MTKSCCEKCKASHSDGTPYCGNYDCPCHSPQKNWEERFEQEAPLAYGGREWAKNFIREALASQRETLAVEIENEKKDEEVAKALGNDEAIFVGGYNRGLTDAAAHIRKQ